MSQIKRTELPALLNDQSITSCPVFLFFGERYLAREAADQLQQTLLDQGGGTLHPLDGDQEDGNQILARLMSYSLLPGRQIYRVSDSRIFASKTVAATVWEKAQQSQEAGKRGAAMRHLITLAQIGAIPQDRDAPFAELSASQWQKLFGFAKPADDLGWADTLIREAIGTGKMGRGGADVTERLIKAFTSGIPPQNCLVLTAEAVDKRQRLFTFIKKQGVVVDCSVAAGASSQAQQAQQEVVKELLYRTLAEFGKKIEPRAIEMFFDRVGFHPVAVVNETEKLALYALDRPTITCADLEEMVGRSREDALFELTDAFGKRQVAKTLTILHRLQENGTHALAILATMRNYLKKLLVFRSLQLQATPAWHKGMNARQFQSSYLPALKEHGVWPDLLAGHPYALYMSFTKAEDFSCDQLKKYFTLLLGAEFSLKGSHLPQHIVLDELFLTMLKKR
ncbi:MAG: DNA polymerase III subunit delta [Desulfopila sp.]